MQMYPYNEANMVYMKMCSTLSTTIFTLMLPFIFVCHSVCYKVFYFYFIVAY